MSRISSLLFFRRNNLAWVLSLISFLFIPAFGGCQDLSGCRHYQSKGSHQKTDEPLPSIQTLNALDYVTKRKYASTGWHCFISESNNQKLHNTDQNLNSDKPMTWSQTFEDIELILNFPRVNEIEYLKKDEEIEYHGHMNWGTIHLKNITHVPLHIYLIHWLVHISHSPMAKGSSRNDHAFVWCNNSIWL